MDVQVIGASKVPTPPPGFKTLFINTEDNNILSWKDSSGVVTRFIDGDADCCACEIAKDYAEGITCALNKGMLKAADFKALIDAGFTATANSTDDGAGNKTCTVTFGSTNVS